MKTSHTFLRILVLLALVLSLARTRYAHAAEPKPPRELFGPGPCTAGSMPQNLVTGGNIVFFSAAESLHGREIYRSDGTQAGTWRVTELAPGAESLKPTPRMAAAGKLYFTTNEPPDTTPAKQRLWVTDGTPAVDGVTGAVELLDFWPEAGGYTISAMAELNGVMYFIVKNPASYYFYDSHSELWRTDGTNAGTWLVKAYTPYSNYYEIPGELVAYKGYLYFDGGINYSNELWRSDGTPEGTGSFGGLGSSHDFIPSGGFLYFFSGTYLYRTDGTTSGTTRVATLPYNSGSDNLTELNGTLYFTVNNTYQGEIWHSDGTTSGTHLIKSIGSYSTGTGPTELTAIGNNLFFVAALSEDDRELWKTDGTPAGTVQVKDLLPGGYGSYPEKLTAFSGKVYFITRNLAMDTIQLWRSDGTSSGTQLVLDAGIIPMDEENGEIAVTANRLFFSGMAPCAGWELQTLSAGSLALSLTMDINQDLVTTSLRHTLTGMGGLGFFYANDFVHGYELWRSDGTLQGTRMVKDINPTGSIISGPYPDPQMFSAGNLLYFCVNDYWTERYLWRTDGSAAGTQPVKLNNGSPAHCSDIYGATAFQNQLFYFSQALTGYDLWKTDDSPTGTQKVGNLPGSGFGTELGGKLYYLLSTSRTQQQLWVTDGSAAGTKMVKSLQFDYDFPQPSVRLLRLGDRLYFIGFDANGAQPWVTDGTAEGTHLLAQVDAGNFTLTGSDNTLYMIAKDEPGYRVWTNRGAAESSLTLLYQSTTKIMMDYQSLNGKIFFTETDPDWTNTSLWISDGTAAGTSPLLLSSGETRVDYWLFAAQPYVFFNATDAAGQELWQSDGSPEGTHRVADLWPGPGSSYPWIVGYDGARLYFFASDGSTPERQKYDSVFYAYDPRNNGLFLPVAVR